VKLLFAGGGTGGHLYPALAVADALRSQSLQGKWEIVFVGTADRLEASIVPGAGYPLFTIAARPLGNPLESLRAIFANVAGVAQSVALLRRLRPDMIIATGGYVCFPVVVAAKIVRPRVPIALFEPNVKRGLTNRLVAPLADEIWTGIPVRASLRDLPERAAAVERLQLDSSLQTLLVMGGSQGARSINDAVVAVVRDHRLPAGWQVLHVTGSGEFERVRAAYAAIAATRVRVVAYLNDPADAYASADLALARAGGATLAELAAVGLPSVLVPYPHATGDHQTLNARARERTGAALVVPDRDIEETLAPALIAAVGQLDAMRMAALPTAPDPLPKVLARIDALTARRVRVS
jgi:UDP-N-acetylglucosamine--N-acetylmuramyl-(pentapeptide) pyrophosphoryl-undecaprenol N-acetylglucosamine transferase